MSKAENLIGIKFGRLTPIKRVESFVKNGGAMWLCVCECGRYTEVQAGNLKSGHVKSCGCLFAKSNVGRPKEEHDYDTRLYKIWINMKQRCNYEKSDNYKFYGGRGIKVCGEWKTFPPFKKWAMLNGYENDLTLDRIDVNSDYSPSNCRFVTKKQQARNRRNNVTIEIDGKIKCASELSEIYGVSDSCIRYRIKAGCDSKELLAYMQQRGGKTHE